MNSTSGGRAVPRRPSTRSPVISPFRGVQPEKEAAFALIMMNGKEKDGSFIVSNAVQYMQEHFREKITFRRWPEKIYVSQWHLSKL